MTRRPISPTRRAALAALLEVENRLTEPVDVRVAATVAAHRRRQRLAGPRPTDPRAPITDRLEATT